MKIEAKRLAELESVVNRLEEKLRRFQARINALEQPVHLPVSIFSRWLPLSHVISAWGQSISVSNRIMSMVLAGVV
jgi:hypothetical protein